MAAVAEYRAACDAVQPAWERMLAAPVCMPESADRRETRMEYMRVQGEVAVARKRLLELALDGRWETPQ
jgi:hypothetical protein